MSNNNNYFTPEDDDEDYGFIDFEDDNYDGNDDEYYDSDDEYAEYAVPAFKALNGRAMFIVAGAPACMDDLKAAGIENFIHVRVNVLDTLKEFNAKLLK